MNIEGVKIQENLQQTWILPEICFREMTAEDDSLHRLIGHASMRSLNSQSTRENKTIQKYSTCLIEQTRTKL